MCSTKSVRAGDVIALAAWTAEYYAVTPASIDRGPAPKRADHGRRAQDAGRRITAAGLGLWTKRGEAGPFSLTSNSSLLELWPPAASRPELAARLRRGYIARLARQALVSLRQDRVNRDPFSPDFEAPPADRRRLTGAGERARPADVARRRARVASPFCTASPAAARRKSICGSPRQSATAAGQR
jgi:hypothetical protein